MKNSSILFFLTPKKDVDCVYEDENVRSAAGRLARHEFTTVPIINEHTGRYIGTISEGDFLRELARQDRLPSEFNELPVMQIKRKRDYRPVRISADINELFHYAMNQNFVPVVDDTDTFISIVTRSSILKCLYSQYTEMQDQLKEAEVI